MKIEVAKLADGNWYYRIYNGRKAVAAGPGMGATSRRQATKLARKRIRSWELDVQLRVKSAEWEQRFIQTGQQLENDLPADWETVS